jgi:RNA polymerase sigma factor (TIGR02999 family)
MSSEVTRLMEQVREGDLAARDELFSLAYDDLRRIARARLRDGGRNTMLNTTDLVHDSFLRLLRSEGLRIEDRRAFFAYASRVMRSVIVDSARQRQSERRGGDAQLITLSTELSGTLAHGEDEILRVHEALEVLAQADARMGQVVEMRYFGGYSELEIADALGVNERTIRRDWEKARIILRAALSGA